MTTPLLQSSDELYPLRSIKADSLIPQQRETPMGFRTACDFRQQFMIKAPFLCQYHSYAESLYAALLESDPRVASYTPQPFLLTIGRGRYTPDFFVTRHNKPARVIELKAAKSQMSEEKIQALSAFFEQEIGARFKVVQNQAVYEKQVLAENWLRICRRLHLGRFLDTRNLEEQIMTSALTHPGSTLWDLIRPHSAGALFEREIAVLRRVHKGDLKINLTEVAIHFDMEVTL